MLAEPPGPSPWQRGGGGTRLPLTQEAGHPEGELLQVGLHAVQTPVFHLPSRKRDAKPPGGSFLSRLATLTSESPPPHEVPHIRPVR